MEATNEYFATNHATWRSMFPEIADDGTSRVNQEEEDYVSEEDDDYVPNPETEVASDDNRSVHTESADQSDEDDQSQSCSADASDQDEDDSDQNEELHNAGHNSGKGKLKVSGGGVLASLMAHASPPSSPRVKKRGKGACKRASGKGTKEMMDSDAEEEHGDGHSHSVVGRPASKLAQFYSSWDAEY